VPVGVQNGNRRTIQWPITVHRLTGTNLVPLEDSEHTGDALVSQINIEPASVWCAGPKTVLDRASFMPTEAYAVQIGGEDAATAEANVPVQVGLVTELDGRPIHVDCPSVQFRCRAVPSRRFMSWSMCRCIFWRRRNPLGQAISAMTRTASHPENHRTGDRSESPGVNVPGGARRGFRPSRFRARRRRAARRPFFAASPIDRSEQRESRGEHGSQVHRRIFSSVASGSAFSRTRQRRAFRGALNVDAAGTPSAGRAVSG